MFELGLVLGLLVSVALVLVVVLLRRGNGATTNADGLRLEQERRDQAHLDRSSYKSSTLHGNAPTMSDHYRP